MRTWLAVVDRTAVLFLGVAAGIAIGFAFGGDRTPAPVVIPQAGGGGEAIGPGLAPPPPATNGGTPAPQAAGAASSIAAPPPPEVGAVLAGAMPVQNQLLATVQAGQRVRVGVFGDSFGDGVWSGLNHLLTGKAGYDVVKFSRQATGFTRYKSLDLERHAREQLGAAPIDIAVVSFGANDTQGVIDRDGHYAALMSPGWQKEIGARVAGFVGVLRQHGAMVYWVGLPRMRKAAFDADIMNMDAFYEARMRALGVPFIDTRPYASDAAGNYAAYLPDPKDGHQVLMRADDGIHMSMNGYVWITRGLAGRIRAYVDAARAQAGLEPVGGVALAAVTAVPKAPATPSPKPEVDRPRPAPDTAPRERTTDSPPRDRPKPPAEKPRPASGNADRASDAERSVPQPAAARAPAPKPVDRIDDAERTASRPAAKAAASKPSAERAPREKPKPAWLRTDEDPPAGSGG